MNTIKRDTESSYRDSFISVAFSSQNNLFAFYVKSSTEESNCQNKKILTP